MRVLRRRAIPPAALVLAGLVGLALAGCAGAPRTTGGATMEYLDTWRRLQAEGAPFAAGSKEEARAIARFQDVLADFKAPGLAARAAEVYAPGAWFNDTLKTVRGGEAIGNYLGKTAEALERGTVEFLDVVGSNGDYYVRWEMRLRFARLDRGRPTPRSACPTCASTATAASSSTRTSGIRSPASSSTCPPSAGCCGR
ncbi:MAG: nuclear transport factor 2 family protein [Thermoanaerobaculia bacterium]|nr:nuclear transport factor 2 family protein [Thermoanaerobaculia bacterium]